MEIGLTGRLNKYYFGFLDTRLNKYYFGASPKSSPKFLYYFGFLDTRLNKYYFGASPKSSPKFLHTMYCTVLHSIITVCTAYINR